MAGVSSTIVQWAYLKTIYNPNVQGLAFYTPDVDWISYVDGSLTALWQVWTGLNGARRRHIISSEWEPSCFIKTNVLNKSKGYAIYRKMRPLRWLPKRHKLDKTISVNVKQLMAKTLIKTGRELRLGIITGAIVYRDFIKKCGESGLFKGVVWLQTDECH